MDTGTKIYRNYFPLKFGWQCACKYGELYPVLRKIMYPGDVFKINADLLIRYQPMLAPPMNNAVATVRFAFVPLRLIEENTELIITGSQDGKLYENTLPVFDSVFKNLHVDADATKNKIFKDSILDLLYDIPPGITFNASLLAKLDSAVSSPAAYFAKAYYRFWWDYYRDENLYGSSDFETDWLYWRAHLHELECQGVCIKKDRITSSLPWQLKATAAPTIAISGTGTFTPNYSGSWAQSLALPPSRDVKAYIYGHTNPLNPPIPFVTNSTEDGDGAAVVASAVSDNINAKLNTPQSVTFSAGTINADQFRTMMAQTRIFERLARCGSRYTEYLRANFGIAPSDGTLQRAQYIGGFKTNIVTTEVVQTAEDGTNPVGTLRGHGITHGTSTIGPFQAKEIGVMIGVLDVKPETIYANGVDRELCARSRFDFLNPSFQHLSEQEVRKAEVYFDTDVNSDGNLQNDDTWGFQPYAQELRTGVKHVVGDMRDNLSYWNQALILSSRPSLNIAFITAKNHMASYNRPFAVSGVDAKPLVIDFGGVIQAYRPLVKDGTPGLTDHN